MMNQSADPSRPEGETKRASLTVRKTESPVPSPLHDPMQQMAEQAATIDEAVAKAMQDGGTLEERIITALKQVYDPEIPVNIYELGLIYGVDIDESNNVKVTMTLTSPACPVAQELPLQAQRAVARVPEVKDVEVDLTFDPPWGPEKMSDLAKIATGMM